MRTHASQFTALRPCLSHRRQSACRGRGRERSMPSSQAERATEDNAPNGTEEARPANTPIVEIKPETDWREYRAAQARPRQSLEHLGLFEGDGPGAAGS